jgi:hypothetical protein
MAADVSRTRSTASWTLPLGRSSVNRAACRAACPGIVIRRDRGAGRLGCALVGPLRPLDGIDAPCLNALVVRLWNPYYHTRGVTPDKVDFGRQARAVDDLGAAVAELVGGG